MSLNLSKEAKIYITRHRFNIVMVFILKFLHYTSILFSKNINSNENKNCGDFTV